MRGSVRLHPCHGVQPEKARNRRFFVAVELQCNIFQNPQYIALQHSEAAQKALAAIFRDSPGIAWAKAEERYGWLIHAVSGTPAVHNPVRDTIFRRALAIGSRSFILETYTRFPKVFNARKRPAKPFVTDIGEADGAVCASHKPRGTGVG